MTNTPTMSELVKWFSINYKDLWKTMHESSHAFSEDKPNPYHLEGSIAVHTMMVCLMASDDNIIVKLSSLLHDIGKPKTREVDYETSKVSFNGHEGVSFFLSIEILNKLEQLNVISLNEKKEILTLISLHSSLFDRIKNENEFNADAFVQMFNDISVYRNLIKQIKNDFYGRFMDDEVSKKKIQNLIGNKIYNDDTFNKYYKNPISENAPTITMLVGLPGSGKTTYRQSLENSIVISRDDVLMDYCKELGFNGSYSESWKYLEENNLHSEVDKIELQKFNSAVKSNKNIVIDRTNMSKKSRRKWLAPKKYKKVAVIFATEYNEVINRNKLRIGKDINTSIIDSMMRGFSIPTYIEFNEIQWIF